MVSQTKENYLKAIYFLEQRHRSVTITELGEVMKVSKPTANNMVKKLTARGWIDYKKYKPIKLSEAGKKQAALIVRKHRLTEMFLVDIMQFGWEEVHEIAEEMEHLKSQRFFDRMDKLLGSPTMDPHGSPIPGKGGAIVKQDFIPLSDCNIGDEVILKAVSENTDSLLKMLSDKQIQLGTKLIICKIEPFDKSMLIDYHDYKNVSYSYEVCRRLMVQKCS